MVVQHQRGGPGVGGVVVGGQVEDVGPGDLAHHGVRHAHVVAVVAAGVLLQHGLAAPGAGGGAGHAQEEAHQQGGDRQGHGGGWAESGDLPCQRVETNIGSQDNKQYNANK